MLIGVLFAFNFDNSGPKKMLKASVA